MEGGSVSYVFTAEEFCKKLIDLASNYKTLYVRGCIGAPMNAYNKKRYIAHHPWNATEERAAMINAATPDTFGFDCVCTIKSILWGWCGDRTKAYGGAVYQSNGVPDINELLMINACSDISTDFSKIIPGEAVWIEGHIGVYVGDGLAVECTPKWDNKVQITACNCTKKGYHKRTWTKHGKLPWIKYPSESFNVGEIVQFNGNVHYPSTNSSKGLTCKPGKARVYAKYPNGKHPYSLIRIRGGGSTVYGWVDDGTMSKL